MTSGSSFFTMSDVNLVFTAPISPKRILAYGFMKQLYTSLFMIFFLLFQIPNLKNFFNIGVGGILIVFTAIFLYMFGLSMITMLVYSAASKSGNVKKNLERALNAVLVLFGVSFILVFLNNKNIGNSMLIFLNSSCISYIPFIGWVKSMMMSAISGLGSGFMFLDKLTIILIAVGLGSKMIFKTGGLSTILYAAIYALFFISFLYNCSWHNFFSHFSYSI